MDSEFIQNFAVVLQGYNNNNNNNNNVVVVIIIIIFLGVGWGVGGGVKLMFCNNSNNIFLFVQISL